MKYSKIILNTFAVLVLLAIVGCAYFTWCWSGDFANYNAVRSGHPFFYPNSLIGRNIIVAIVYIPLFKFLAVEKIAAIWSVFFIFCSYVLGKILAIDYPGLNRHPLLRTAIIAAVLWVGSVATIGQSVYWASGGFIIFALFCALLWILKTSEVNKKFVPVNFYYNLPFFLLAFFLSVIVGLLNFNLTLGLLTLGLIFTYYSYQKNGNSKSFVYNLVSTLGLFIGLFIILLFPRYFSPFNHQPLIGRDALTFLISGKSVFYFSLIGSILLAYLAKNNYAELRSRIVNLGVSEFVFRFKFLLAAIVISVAIIFTQKLTFQIVTIYYYVFLALFVFSFLTGQFVGFFNSLENKPVSGRKLFYFYFIVNLLLFLLFSRFVYLTIKDTRTLKNQLVARDALLRSESNKNQDVEVESIKGATPRVITDISSDPQDTLNKIIAEYYGLKSIHSKSETK